MKTTTQRSIAKRLDIDPSFFCKLINGKQRPSARRAASLEVSTGIGIRTWLFGRPDDIRRELERAFGKINFKTGRPLTAGRAKKGAK